MTDEEAREWARHTRAEQGLAFHVTDPGVLHRVLTLLGRTAAVRAAPAQRPEDDAA